MLRRTFFPDSVSSYISWNYSTQRTSNRLIAFDWFDICLVCTPKFIKNCFINIDSLWHNVHQFGSFSQTYFALILTFLQHKKRGHNCSKKCKTDKTDVLKSTRLCQMFALVSINICLFNNLFGIKYEILLRF